MNSLSLLALFLNSWSIRSYLSFSSWIARACFSFRLSCMASNSYFDVILNCDNSSLTSCSCLRSAWVASSPLYIDNWSCFSKSAIFASNTIIFCSSSAISASFILTCSRRAICWASYSAIRFSFSRTVASSAAICARSSSSRRLPAAPMFCFSSSIYLSNSSILNCISPRSYSRS